MKIVSLADIAGLGGVLALGCFDYLHIGHHRYLRKAAELGPLFVSVTADQFVNKGPDRPYYSHDIRAEMIADLAFVHCVIINYAPTELNVIETLRPRYYCKGTEYAESNPVLDEARYLLHSYGGEIIFLDDEGKKYSSTEIIKNRRMLGAAKT